MLVERFLIVHTSAAVLAKFFLDFHLPEIYLRKNVPIKIAPRKNTPENVPPGGKEWPAILPP